MYIRSESGSGCDLRFSEHAKRRISARSGVTIKRVREAYLDPGGIIFKLRAGRRALLGRSDDGLYLTLILQLGRSCDLLITARTMDDKEKRRYRKGW